MAQRRRSGPRGALAPPRTRDRFAPAPSGRLRHAQADPAPRGRRPRDRGLLELRVFRFLSGLRRGDVRPGPPPGDAAAVRPVRAGAAARDALRRGDLPGPGRQPVRPGRPRPRVHVRPRRRHRVVRHRPALRHGRQPPRPGVRPRGGVRQRLRPGLRRAHRRHLRHQQRRRPQPVPRRGRGAPPHRRPGEGDHPPRATRRRAHVRHRHLGLDGPRGPPRPRQAGADLPRRSPPAPRHRRDRRVRHRRPGHPRADVRPGCRPHPVGDRLAAAQRLDQRRGRPPARLPARVRRPARGRHQPRDPGLGRRRQPRQHRPGVDPRPRPPGRRAGDPARHRRLRDGQLQRRR